MSASGDILLAPSGILMSLLSMALLDYVGYTARDEEHGEIAETDYEKLNTELRDAAEPTAAEHAEEDAPQCGLDGDAHRTPVVGAEPLIPDAPACEGEAAGVEDG